MAPDNQPDQPPVWTEEQLKRRRQRSVVMAIGLGIMMFLFFAVTVVRLGGNVLNRPL